MEEGMSVHITVREEAEECRVRRFIFFVLFIYLFFCEKLDLIQSSIYPV